MTLSAILAIIMMVVGGGLFYLTIRNNDTFIPKGWSQWAAVASSVLLFGFAGFLYRQAQIIPPAYEDIAVGADELNQPAENFAFRLITDDTEHELEEYKGKLIVLNFWATWCGPCIREIPALDQLQTDFAAEGLVVLTLSDEPRTDLLASGDMLPKEAVAGYLAVPDSLPQPFRRTLIMRPVTYIIGRDGQIHQFYNGARSYVFFEKRVRSYLQEPQAMR